MREIWFPVFLTFYNFFYLYVSTAPGFIFINAYQSYAGALLSMAGISLSLISVIYLGRNFSVLADFRGFTRKGPYRYARHPMYAGYIITYAGFTLMFLNAFTAAVTILFIILVSARALIEEKVMVSCSADYRTYAKTTGMFIPRFTLINRRRQ